MTVTIAREQRRLAARGLRPPPSTRSTRIDNHVRATNRSLTAQGIGPKVEGQRCAVLPLTQRPHFCSDARQTPRPRAAAEHERSPFVRRSIVERARVRGRGERSETEAPPFWQRVPARRRGRARRHAPAPGACRVRAPHVRRSSRRRAVVARRRCRMQGAVGPARVRRRPGPLGGTMARTAGRGRERACARGRGAAAAAREQSRALVSAHPRRDHDAVGSAGKAHAWPDAGRSYQQRSRKHDGAIQALTTRSQACGTQRPGLLAAALPRRSRRRRRTWRRRPHRGRLSNRAKSADRVSRTSRRGCAERA